MHSNLKSIQFCSSISVHRENGFPIRVNLIHAWLFGNRLCWGSRAYETHTGESDADDDEEYLDSFNTEDDARPRKRRPKTDSQPEDMRKHVMVDSKGIPYGTMKKVLEQEVKLLAKDLDPRHSWEGQPQHAKDRFFKRVYAGMAPPTPSHAHVAWCDIQDNV